MRPSRWILSTVPLVLAAQARGGQTASTLVFERVTVVSMEGRDLRRDQTVVVREGSIVEIGPAGAVTIPSGATRIDGKNRYLFPGLSDTHVHLEVTAAEWMPLFLAHGVTTVFNLQGAERHLELRRRVQAGEIPGPTIYTSGPFTNQPAIATAADAERAVAEQKAAGYDFVKIHGNLTAEAYAALIAAGRAHGITITGHAPRNLPFDSVIAARQPLVVHAEELIYTKFRALDSTELAPVAAATAHAGIWVTPTATTFSGITRQWGRPAAVDSTLGTPEGAALPAGIRQYWESSNRYTGRSTGFDWAPKAYRFHAPLIRALSRAGVPLLTGTDTPLPVMIPGHSLHDEIAELEQIGLDRFDVLRAATVNPGRFIATFVDSSARFGTVSRGSRADLVLTERNPLDDPGTLVHPIGVMARGRWYDRATLDRLVEAASRAAPPEPPKAALTLTDLERRAFVGEYRSEDGARSARIIDRDGKLHFEVPGQPVFELVPLGPRRFTAAGSMTRIELEFDSARTTLTASAGGTPFAVLRRAP